jgi:hypothetical protein
MQMLRSARELKTMVDQLLAQVTPLETQIGVLGNTIIDTTTELKFGEVFLRSGHGGL